MKNEGTPKILDIAILNAILEIASKLTDKPNSTEIIYDHIKDFIAQKFGVAYLEAQEDKKTLRVLEDLFEALTIRDADPLKLKGS